VPKTGKSAHSKSKPKAKPKTVRPGRVEKIIKSPFPNEPEKAEIAVEGADHLYREIRIENSLEDSKGNAVKLKTGVQVDVIVEADDKDTVPKSK
jgi:hypothetical protein